MSVLTITKENFKEKVQNVKGTVLLDFWSNRCGPCRMLAPVIEEIAEENDDKIIGKVNVDEEYELTEQFGISHIPTLLIFKDGELIRQSTGFLPKEEILALLD